MELIIRKNNSWQHAISRIFRIMINARPTAMRVGLRYSKLRPIAGPLGPMLKNDSKNDCKLLLTAETASHHFDLFANGQVS